MDGIGERLKEARLRNGWSQKDLARESGTNVDTISGIETGQHEPRPSTLRKLAKALDIEVRQLFEEPVPLGGSPREAGQRVQEKTAERREWLDNLLKTAQPIMEQDDQTIAAHRQALARMKGKKIEVADSYFAEEESPEQAKLAAETLDFLLHKEEERRQEKARQ